MIPFTVYNDQGRVMRTGSAPENSIAIQAGAGEFVVEGVVSEDHYAVRQADGSVQTTVLPAKPSENHSFDYSTKQWVDPRTLDQIKVMQWDKVKLARTASLTAPLPTPYGAFDADEPSQKAITDAVLMLQTLAALGTPATINFTLNDNSVATLTTTQMVTVGLLLGQRTQECFAQGRVLRAAIEAATTTSAIEAIVWA